MNHQLVYNKKKLSFHSIIYPLLLYLSNLFNKPYTSNMYGRENKRKDVPEVNT